MFTLLAATALAVTKFPGGTANDFAASLAQASQQNVAVIQGMKATVKPCEFDPSDLNELARAIRNQTQLAILPGPDLLISDGKIDPSLVTESEGGSSQEGVPFPAAALDAGKVTFKTEKTDLLAINSFASTFGKPVNVHWIYKDVNLAVQVKNMPQTDFLKWVAKAVGGRLVETTKDYTIALDPIEIRRRAVNTILAQKLDQSDPNTFAMLQKKQSFRAAALNSLNATQLLQALATPGGETRVVLSANNPLTRTASTYVQNLAQYQQMAQVQNAQADQGTLQQGRRRMRMNRNGGDGSAVGVLQRVDPSRASYLIVNSHFDVSFEIAVLDNRGRSAGVVHF